MVTLPRENRINTKQFLRLRIRLRLAVIALFRYNLSLILSIVQPRLSEHVGIRQKRSDNRGCLYINAIMRGPRRSVRIIECSDNRSSDNRGFTVYTSACNRSSKPQSTESYWKQHTETGASQAVEYITVNLVHITELPQQLVAKPLNKCRHSHEHSKVLVNSIHKQSVHILRESTSYGKKLWIPRKQQKQYFTRK